MAKYLVIESILNDPPTIGRRSKSNEIGKDLKSENLSSTGIPFFFIQIGIFQLQTFQLLNLLLLFVVVVIALVIAIALMYIMLSYNFLSFL